MEGCQKNNIMLENMEYMHHIIKFLGNKDITNMMCLNTIFFHNLRRSKILIKNFKREYHKEVEDGFYMKNNFFLIVNRDLISEVIKKTDEIFVQSTNKTKNLIYIWVGVFIFLTVNLFSIFLYLKLSNLLGSSMHVYLLPFNMAWMISIGIYLKHLNLQTNLKFSILMALEKSFENMKNKNHTNKKYLLDMLLLRSKNEDHKFFEKIIQTFILFYSPMILKNIMQENITNEFILILSALLVILWEYITSLLNFLKSNIEKKSETLSRYKEISNKKINLNFKVTELANEIEIQNKNKICLDTELGLNSIYFIFKLGIYVIIFFYFKNLGAKIDNNSYVSWTILFIPIYLAEVPIIVYCILHFFALKDDKCSKITKAFSLLCAFSGFFINSIIIPLKAEGHDIHAMWIPILFGFSSVNIFIHHKYVS